jgi:hypothetical protein
MPPLLDDIWSRRGISLIWGASGLARAKTSEIVPLRKLFQMAEAGFTDPLPSNEGRLLIATGLEGALDVLTSEDAEAWTIECIRPVLMRFQETWDGGGALAFWLPSGGTRIVERPARAAYDWRLPVGYGEKTLPLSELIFSGADDDLQQIMDQRAYARPELIGLYHPRMS